MGTDREGEGRGRGKSGSYFHGPDEMRVGRTRVAAELGENGGGLWIDFVQVRLLRQGWLGGWRWCEGMMSGQLGLGLWQA